ncbi:MAG: hypothetical protein OHK0017_02380 [Patescibacteria group bacterium]
MPITIQDFVSNHNNDYGFNPDLEISNINFNSDLSSLSVVIPYYRTGDIICLVLKHLYNSILKVKNNLPNWNYEVIIVDDGSPDRQLTNYVNTSDYLNLKLISLEQNGGRAMARNKGLVAANFEKVLFIDSDVLIDSNHIINHLKLHYKAWQISKKNIISVGLFEFTDQSNQKIFQNEIKPTDLNINDYRVHCIYQSSWIGTISDLQFAGQDFRILKQTNYFRNWKGNFGPWSLVNMVLGGSFSLDRREAMMVNGFSNKIKGYGFDETTLPAKLIAKFNSYLIPVVVGGGIHIEDPKINLSQEQKDIEFRKKYDFFFNTYMKLNLEDAIYEDRK